MKKNLSEARHWSRLSNILLLFVIILFFASCNFIQSTNNGIVFQSKEQNRFKEFILQNNNMNSYLGNDIKKEEHYKKYLIELASLSDSIGIFKNWEGQIIKIEVEEPSIFNGLKENYRLLNIEIKIQLEPEYQYVTLYCKKLFKVNEADSLLLYRQAKNTSVNSEIYFDGFISKNSENKVNFETSIMPSDTYYMGELSYPNIKFHIISLSSEPLKFTNNADINLLMNKNLFVWKSMTDFSKRKISRNKLKTIMADCKSEIETPMSKLTLEEKNYIKSYTDCLSPRSS
jgi:hypothetical protein